MACGSIGPPCPPIWAEKILGGESIKKEVGLAGFSLGLESECFRRWGLMAWEHLIVQTLWPFVVCTFS